MSVRVLVFYVLMVLPAIAQGFAGLGGPAEGFAKPSRATVLQFPQDHGAHRPFRVEWWYLTANLRGDDGEDYGVQWTLFRVALSPDQAPGWEDPQVWMGHAAITSKTRHLAAERFARSGVGQAGVELAPFRAWIDNWHMTGEENPSADQLSRLAIGASGEGFSYDLTATAHGPIVLQGDAGYSVKSLDGHASHYYSQPFYAVAGAIVLEGRRIAVTGQAWLDREWSSQPLTEDQAGWDWFSLHFDDGEKLMVYRFRDHAGDYLSGTWISANGKPQPLAPDELALTPLETADVAGRRIPVRWRLQLPARRLDIETRPLNPQAWMDLSVPYWEGPIRFGGTKGGVGYLEMTGYK